SRRRARRRSREADRLLPRYRTALPALRSSESPGRRLASEVGTRVAYRFGTSFRLLPVLLASERREVEERVRTAEPLGPPRVERIRVEHIVALAQEHAEARLLGRALEHPVHASLAQLPLVHEVVFDGRFARIERHVEVVVEI